MKKILGLDLGTNSIGWAVVNEAENETEQSSIVKLGVRVNPLTVDELGNFEKGKSIPTNAERTLKRSIRRNLHRYKLRRANLIEILLEHHWIDENTILSEQGNNSTFETYRLRAKAATEMISLSEFARVLLMINKKRGYKSSRKAQSGDEGQIIDGMSVAKRLYEENLTPGQYSYSLICAGKKKLPDYYRSDLQCEFDRIWNFQKQFYDDKLTVELKENLVSKNSNQTWAICAKPWNLVGLKRNLKRDELKKENYKLRCNALSEKLDLEYLAIVLQEINGQINASSGYLGSIGDRSKELYFNNQTVGQYQMAELTANPNYSLRNQVFYRQDYLDEFEKIWEKQAQHHKELTPELKSEIRDVIIFYQRPLKSQKGLVSFCEFESRQVEVEVDGKKKIKTIGMKVCPKSSPVFQEFKILQVLNNIIVSNKETKEKFFLNDEEKEALLNELKYKDKLSKKDVLKFLYKDDKGLDMNFKEIEGDRTQSALFKVYQAIIENSGNGEYDFSKMNSKKALEIVSDVFSAIGVNTAILSDFKSEYNDFENHPYFKLWHLLYSFEGDKSVTGYDNLVNALMKKYGFDEEGAVMLANVSLQPDYGSLSTKAMRKIIPFLRDGKEYSEACSMAGYRHSARSLTKEEIEKKELVDKLQILPKNSLRNPVVEKILNQMINVVNQVKDTYGKPDEIRIELARELKKSAKEREEMTKQINSNSKLHEDYIKILHDEFGLQSISRNDIIRYKLYLELEKNGYHTLYTNTYIPREKLFSKEFDIEHIIPQAKVFDDSFSNKTLERRDANIAKGNLTAADYVATLGQTAKEEYFERVMNLFNAKVISKTKMTNLLTKEEEIPSGFVNRDLRDSQYIAKKAKEILESYVRVVVPTTGSVTDRLREDWQLVDIMKELNWDKYDKLGLTYYETDKDGRTIGKIKDWTKRNDHRHHAMDALTIAFTKHSYIQYLNNLNARVQKGVDEYFDLDTVEISKFDKEQRTAAVYAIERKELYRDSNHKLRFRPPFPLDEFRREAKKQLENILVSIKAKNKVVTKNINVIKQGGGKKGRIVQLTPRGQLHLETVYGSHKQYFIKEEKIGASFTEQKIMLVSNKAYRDALIRRLHEFCGDAKKAFTGKNSLEKNPIYLNEEQTMRVPDKVNLVTFETVYTIRKPISPDIKLDKVVDKGVRSILEARLAEFKGDAKKAFSNLEENPIYINKEKGISIKRVTITGINNAQALHAKRDKDGKIIYDADGHSIAADFVNTGNNHHVAVFRKPKLDKNNVQIIDEKWNPQYELDEHIVSFYEAVARANQGLPIVDKEYKKEEGWQFLFTMKQNEYFVFPRYETYVDESGNKVQKMTFNPLDYNEEWYKNPENYHLISPNLFRVQKFSSKDYVFRHHLETVVDDNNILRDTTWKRIRNVDGLNGIVKVRVTHIGQIVSIGEY